MRNEKKEIADGVRELIESGKLWNEACEQWVFMQDANAIVSLISDVDDNILEEVEEIERELCIDKIEDSIEEMK
jgi:hypothetical protein